ncbi:hypothetical protein, partial [Bacillus cereus]|uniref:hypothetical protein n=1 Tax=Bacillus cereus TaxID=1396 RepID=UPI001484E274
LDMPIDSISLMNYLVNKYDPVLDRIKPSLGRASKLIVMELLAFGITRISDLDILINKNNMIEIVKQKKNTYKTFAGALRQLMIMEDAEKYFEKAYQGDWKARENSPIIGLAKEKGMDTEKLKQLKVIV